jgi:hypothetical protein
MHWFASTGVLAIARGRTKVFPIVGDVIAKFRRDLKVFQTFEIHTRLMGWDHKWGFLEHRFVRNQRVIRWFAIRGVFNGPRGPLDPGVLLSGLAHADPSPQLPSG